MKRCLWSLLVLLLAISLCACGNPAYKEGKQLLTSGDYQAAAEKFAESIDYKDSDELRKQALYKYGNECLAAGDLEEARKVFSDLGEYEDSVVLLQETNYQRALKAIEEKKYYQAESILKDLGDYKDSEALNSRAKNLELFEKVLSYIDEGKYERAYTKLKEIKGLDEADELLGHFTVVQRLRFYRVIQTDNFGKSSRHQENLSYDSKGRLLYREAANGSLFQTSSYIHAWAVNPLSSAHASAEVYYYDDADRLIKIEGMGPPHMMSAGIPVGPTDYVVEFEYNEQNQISKEKVVTGTDTGEMDLAYDDNGNLIRVQADPNHGFAITYNYDANGNLLSCYNTVNYGYSETYSYTFDDDGRISQAWVSPSYSSAFTETYTYDDNGRLAKVVRDFSDPQTLDVTFEWDYRDVYLYS